MSAWKSRWSWVRLVNSATSKWIASHAVQRQRVRGDLHRAGPVAAVEHAPEGRLQVDRLGRRPLDLLLRPRRPPASPSPAARTAPRPPRGSPGAGTPWSSSRSSRSPRRPSAPPSGRRRSAPRAAPSPPARPRRRPAGPRARSSRSTTSPTAPASTAAGGEVVPIHPLPGHAEEQRPGLDPAAVVGKVGDLDVEVAARFARRQRPRSARSRRHRGPVQSPLARAGPDSGERGAQSPTGRNAEIRKREGRDLAERRRGHRATVDVRPAAGRRSPRPAAAGPAPGRSR